MASEAQRAKARAAFASAMDEPLSPSTASHSSEASTPPAPAGENEEAAVKAHNQEVLAGVLDNAGQSPTKGRRGERCLAGPLLSLTLLPGAGR